MKKLVKKCNILAAIALAFVSAVCGVAALKTKTVTAATLSTEYSSGTQSSATLNSFSISNFTNVTDFTDHFALTYDDLAHEKVIDSETQEERALQLTDVVTLNDNKINIKNNTQKYFGIQFYPNAAVDGTIGATNNEGQVTNYGKTQLGNFEVKITMTGVGVSGGENIYFGSRITSLDGEYILGHESEDYLQNIRLQARITGSDPTTNTTTTGPWSMTVPTTMKILKGNSFFFNSTKVENSMTITVGYINNFCYMYADTVDTVNGNKVTTLKDGGVMISKAPLVEGIPTLIDGSQNFAMYFTGSATSKTEINISKFEYRRLDSAFEYNAPEQKTLELVQQEVNSGAVAEWSDEYTGDATNKSQYLQSLSIERFNTTADFTDWFSLEYASSSKVLNTDYTMSVANGILTIDALKVGTTPKTVGFNLLPSNNYGKSYLGNFEVKIGIEQTYAISNGNVYFGSRKSWATNTLQYEGLKAILVNGYGLQGAVSQTQTYANKDITTATTLTIGFIDNACYFYTGDAPASDLSNVSIYYNKITTSTTHDNYAGQMFSMYLHEDAKISISSFSYRRLDENKYPFDAPDVTTDESVASIREYLAEGEIYPQATFTEGSVGTAKNSSTVQDVNVPQMDRMESFTDYFKLAYAKSQNASDAWHIWSTLSYNKTNKSVQIITPNVPTGNVRYTEWRFMPQTGNDVSYLGNYEMTITIQANSGDMAKDRNVLFGAYRKGDDQQGSLGSFSEDNALFKLHGGIDKNGEGVWTINGDAEHPVPVANKLKITMGFINGFYYYYVNEPNAGYEIHYKDLVKHADETRECSQIFAMVLTEGTKIEVCSFSYQRFNTGNPTIDNFTWTPEDNWANGVTAETAPERNFIEAQMTSRIREYELEILKTQEYEQYDGASVRFSDPYGLRFAALYKHEYIKYWRTRGYEVELGALIGPDSHVDPELLALEYAGYQVNNHYVRIVCAEGEKKYSIVDGYARVNCVLKVSLTGGNYARDFVGITYLRIYDKNNVNKTVYTKYATGGIYYYDEEGKATQYVDDTENRTAKRASMIRNMKYVVQETLKDTEAGYSSWSINYLLTIDSGARTVIDKIEAVVNVAITDDNRIAMQNAIAEIQSDYDNLTAYALSGTSHSLTKEQVQALVTNYNKLLQRKTELLNWQSPNADNGGEVA